MKYLQNIALLLIIAYLGLGQPLNAQPLQKHNNSIRLQLGLFQYNESNNDFIFQNNNRFVSTGITYRREMSRLFALNLTGRYNDWDMNKSMNLQTYAFQALWIVHASNISSSWRTNRIAPYAGVGVGYENHRLTTLGNDTLYQKVYIPFEVGLLFNLSPRWSVGLFSEYKLASVAPPDNLLESPKMRLDLSNVAGISISYSFGENRKEQSVPVIKTNETFLRSHVLEENTNDSTIGLSKNLSINDLLPSDSIVEKSISAPETPDSVTLRKKPKVLSRNAEIISDTIRIPVILDISVNSQNNQPDSNYIITNASRVQARERNAATAPANVYEIPDQQMQGQLRQIDNNLAALQEQYKLQNSIIEVELKNMKLMLGALNAELLLLTATKTKSPDGKMEEPKSSTQKAPSVKIDSLIFLIDSINNQKVTDSIKLGLANSNVSLVAEVNKLKSENKALTDRLTHLSSIADSNLMSDSLDKIVHTITFAVNSTKVDVGQLFQSKSMIDLLKTKPDYKLLLSGYADKSGNAEYNLSLSKKRVQAVKEELIKMGINKTRIMEQYFGSEKATATNNKNDRRVELKVLKSF
jgi:outer membrane protein OmpA-like peptidoglycan-associated protein